LVIFLKVMSRVIPALLTRMSIGPTSAWTFATQAWHDSNSETSTGYAANV